MKKNLVYFFSLLFFFSSALRLQSQCSLDQVGSPNFVTTSALSDMVVAPNGSVYTIAFNSSVNKLQLYMATFPGAFTQQAAISTSTTARPAIAISKLGKVSVLIRDETAGGVAKLYYLSGGSLLQQGTAISTGQASDLSLTFNSAGEELVAYTDVANSGIATVKKWSGSAWASVGTGLVSPGAAAYNSLTVDKNDFPALAYQDATTAPANKISVKRYNGSAWVALGSGAVSANPATNPKLKFSKNNITNYYLGYTEISNSSAIVQLYNGSSWSPLGSPVTNVTTSSGTFGFDIDPTDMPVFTTILSTPPYPVSYKYAAGTWTTLVSYINSSTANASNIMFDAAGMPYYFYVDQPNNNALNVKRSSPSVSLSTQPTSTIVCNGGSSAFYVSAVGGTPTYQWQYLSGGSWLNTTTSYSNSTTSYLSFTGNTSMNQDKIRCVLNAGCINVVSTTATLTVNTLSVAATSTNPTCYNTSDGAISTTVTGGTTPYTYSWSPIGGTGSTATGLYGTTYTLNTTDNIGCTTNTIITLTTPPYMSSSFVGNQSFCIGGSTTMTVVATGGIGAFTYSWTPSVNIAPTTGSVVTMNPSSSITYGVQITDSIGCTATNTVGINPVSLPSVSAGSSLSTICAGSAVSLTASGSADTYTWNPGAITGGTIVVTPMTNTTYTVTGTNTTTGCTNTATVAITVNPIPTANAGPTKTLTCANSTVTLSGSSAGGVSYNWTGPGIVSGSTTLNPVVASVGTYDLSVVSAAGCTSGMSTTNVVQDITPPSPSASNSGAVTCAAPNSTLTGLPASGVSYLWSGPGITGSPTTQITTANAAGSYTLKVTSAVNGCTNTAVTNVTQNTTPPSPTAATTGTLSCFSLTVALSGAPGTGVSYQWSGPGVSGPTTTQNTSASAPGTYTLMVTSAANGCTNTAVTNVTQNTTPPAVTANTYSTLTCYLTTVTAIGGPGTGVTYLWSGPGIVSGATSQNASVNLPGTYSLQATSSINGCTATAITSVLQNTATPVVTTNTPANITCITSNVSVGANTLTSPVSYAWSGTGIVSSPNISTITVNAPGIKNYTVTNTSTGCYTTGTVAVNQNTSTPTVIANASQSITCFATTASLTAVSSADPSTAYSWTSAVAGTLNNYNISNPIAFASGVYTVGVTDTNNGCVASATVEVFTNTTVPASTISFSPSNTITCTDVTVSGIVTSSDPNVDFSWGPVSGIVSGASTATATINQAGTYSVITTNTINGCASTNTMNVLQDVMLPALSVNANPSTICAGNSTTITATGANTYLWGSAQTTASIIDSPSFTTVYTVTGYAANGCSSTMTETVTVNPSPSLGVAGTSTICKGSTTYLTVNGATSYSWSTGATTANISVTPTVTTTYTVSGDNGLCQASLTTTVNIIPSKDITGTITSTAGATGGDVILYKYTAALSRWDSVTTVPLAASYSFSNTDSALYVIRAIPTATNIQVTYAGSSISWQNATVITHGCSINSTQNIQMIGLDNIGIGPGQLSGTIVEGNGFGHRISATAAPQFPGNPIGGIIVKGGKNPGGQMFAQTTTDAGGNYVLSGLPLSTGTNDYFILVDIPGLDTNLTYHTMITSSNPTVSNLDFYVDSMYINPVYVTKVKTESSLFENKVVLYPNPASQYFSIQYELINDSDVMIELYDLVGKKVRTLVPPAKQTKNKYDHRIETDELGTGVYFVKLKLNGNETTIKLILTK